LPASGALFRALRFAVLEIEPAFVGGWSRSKDDALRSPTEMETRPYFMAGDLLANLGVGALVGLAMAAMVGIGWNMLVAMVVGMALGMAISIPPALLLGALLGAMEVMIPVMTTGMVAGMGVSMAASMGEVGLARGAELGALSGVCVIAALYVANSVIRRTDTRWIS